MSHILFLAEHDNAILHPHIAQGLSAARAIGENAIIDVLVIGHDCQVVAESAAMMPGINQVLLANDALLAIPT